MQHAYACIIIPSLPWHANWECWSCSFDPTRSLWFCAMSDKLLSDKSDKVAICIYQATFIWSHPIFSYQLNLITACLLHREYMTNMQFFCWEFQKTQTTTTMGLFQQIGDFGNPTVRRLGAFDWAYQLFVLSIYMDVSKNSGTPKWMVYNGNPYQNGMIWGYPYFWKHPYILPILPSWEASHIPNPFGPFESIVFLFPFGGIFDRFLEGVYDERQVKRNFCPYSIFETSWKRLMDPAYDIH